MKGIIITSMIEIPKILERIKLDPTKEYEPNLETLRLLMQHYILNVPYENLDLALKKEFSVKLEDIYSKIVCSSRGGICYESNTLFAYMLQQLGFDVIMILAKVADTTYIGFDYPHLALLVTLNDDEYLVDVANGQNVREPMPLHNDTFIAIAENNEYKIEHHEGVYTLLVNHRRKGWLPRYLFTKEPKYVSDFACVFEDVDDEIFSQEEMMLVTQALEDGRVTLTHEMLCVKKEGEKTSWEVCKNNRKELLKEYFNIEV